MIVNLGYHQAPHLLILLRFKGSYWPRFFCNVAEVLQSKPILPSP